MEEMIVKMMTKLNISREDAIALIEDDKEVDRMTKMSDIQSDLTEEQKKAAKKAKNVARGVSEKPTAKREKKVDNTKKEIISTLINSLGMATDFEILNDEREFTFNVNGEKYKIVLSKPRK